jgi:hypothetical protein
MDKVKNKEWLENEFESAFDDNTAPTGGGYEADYTDKWGFYRKFEPCIIEYATQQSRIDAIGFLKWFKDDSIIFFDDNGEMYNSLTDEFLSHEQVYELYDSQKPKQ